MQAYMSLAILGVLWLGSLLAAGCAIFGSRRAPVRWFWVWLLMAAGAIGIGYLGYWTPVSIWPQIQYSWTNGNFSIHLDSRWFFIVPLLLGPVALVLVIRRRGRAKSETNH